MKKMNRKYKGEPRGDEFLDIVQMLSRIAGYKLNVVKRIR